MLSFMLYNYFVGVVWGKSLPVVLWMTQSLKRQHSSSQWTGLLEMAGCRTSVLDIIHYILDLMFLYLRGVFDITIWDKVWQWLAAGRWFSPGILVSAINKTDHHDITEIFLKVVLKALTLTPMFKHPYVCLPYCHFCTHIINYLKTLKLLIRIPHLARCTR
jgi:hypothetical protein